MNFSFKLMGIKNTKRTRIIIIIVAILAIIVTAVTLGLYFGLKTDPPCTSCPLKLPKTIYTYWNTTELPQFISMCLENWKRFNPSYEVQLITPDTVAKFIKHPLPRVFKELRPAHQADWIRLAVLAENGGMWLDASTFLTTNFGFVEDYVDNKEAFLYYSDWLAKDNSDTYFPMCESSFLAFKPQSPVINAWFNEYHQSFEDFGNDGKAYVNNLKKGVSEKEFQAYHQKFSEDNWDYFRVYISLQRAVRHKKLPFKNVVRIESRSAPHGIYYLWHLAQGDDSVMINLLTQPWNDNVSVPSVVKFTSYSRNELMKRMNSTNFHPDRNSLYARYLLIANNISRKGTETQTIQRKD